MKNIHILPTDKGTGCLAKSPNSQYYVVSDHNRGISDHIDYNIYITSDEEGIYDKDYYLYEGSAFQARPRDEGNFKNKIILTTDQDLIKDDVQAIDDDFLEWFIKKPSCEYIKTEKWLDDEGKVLYSRIIPKEEPKQETLEEVAEQYTRDTTIFLQGVEVGIKEQQERSYSEEDFTKSVKDAYIMGRNDLLIGVFNK